MKIRKAKPICGLCSLTIGKGVKVYTTKDRHFGINAVRCPFDKGLMHLDTKCYHTIRRWLKLNIFKYF